MARRRRQKTHANHERWLVSYADFITLLFAFFVVMYAASQVDKKKMMRVAASIEGAFQEMGVFQGNKTSRSTPAVGAAPAQAAPEIRALVEAAVEMKVRQEHSAAQKDLEPLRREIEKAMQDEIKKGSITLRSSPDGLVISLSELGFFDSGSARVRPAAEASFHRIAALLAERRCGVRVEGHTDNVPIKTSEFKSNWDLSTARAIEVVKSLIDKYEFDPVLLSAAGYGEYHPVAGNDTPEGRQQNRRVDLVVLSQDTTPQVTTNSNAIASRTAEQQGKQSSDGERRQ